MSAHDPDRFVDAQEPIYVHALQGFTQGAQTEPDPLTLTLLGAA